MYSTNLSKRKT